jgi:hypothetical protein
VSYRDKTTVGSVVENCEVCGRSHLTSKCWNLVKVDHDKKVELLRKKGLCFRCLRRGHLADSCSLKCTRCQGNHNFLLCKADKLSSADLKEKSVDTATTTVSHTGLATVVNKSVLMQVVPVLVKGCNGLVKANVLFDSGSDRSYVSSGLVRRVRPSFKGSESVSYATFGSSKASRGQLRNVYSLELTGLQQGRASVLATEVDVISAPVRRSKVPADILKRFSHLSLAENYSIEKELSIDILVGLDCFWQLVQPEFVSCEKGLVAQKTVFGWLLSGCVATEDSRSSISHQLLCLCDVSDDDVRKFWDIDVMSEKCEVSSVLREFEETVSFENGRYVVALPWANSRKGCDLVDNYDLAVLRLKSLAKKLEKQPEIQTRYDAVLKELQEEGIVEVDEVPPDEVHVSPYVSYCNSEYGDVILTSPDSSLIKSAL